MARLIERWPDTKVKILLVAGFDRGIASVIDAIKSAGLNDSVELIPYIVYSDEDRCFHEASAIIPDGEKRRELSTFCSEIGRKYRIGNPLGLGVLAEQWFLSTPCLIILCRSYGMTRVRGTPCFLRRRNLALTRRGRKKNQLRERQPGDISGTDDIQELKDSISHSSQQAQEHPLAPVLVTEPGARLERSR